MNFPFIATLVFLAGVTGLLLSLLLSAWRHARKAARAAVADGAAKNLPEDFGPRLTSNRLKVMRWAFALLVVAAFGFHVYWALFAAGPVKENEDFAALKRHRDQRNRRDIEANLRGWMFDRHRDIRRCLAKYRYLNGRIIRDYPLGPAAAHIVGYSGLARGDAGLERAVVAQPPPKEEQERSWWEKLVAHLTSGGDKEQTIVAGRDLVLTIDYDLQKEAFAQLQATGKRGAVVLLNPQTGEILALASAPSFDPDDINNDVRWQEISADVKSRPLLNRALSEYYLPGSTLKTLTAAAAIDARQDNLTFFCQSAGWTPPGSGRAIRDDEGEAHGRQGLLDGYAHSCNQYFAQLGVAVERQRMGEAAARFGMKVFNDPKDSIGSGPMRNLWNTDNKILSDVLAPLNSTFVDGKKITKYDLALESIGQGYVQLTPFEMALIAGAVGNLNGNVMRPMIEMGRQPTPLSQAMTPQTAARVRQLMAAVVQQGTARGAFSSIIGAAGITAGGKTGTAQREVPVIDPRTGEVVKDKYRDSRGREHERVRKEHRIDSWFIGFAPLGTPQIAFAVVVEGGGYGAKTSAPIAANLIVKAKNLGLLTSPVPPPQEAAQRGARRQ